MTHKIVVAALVVSLAPSTLAHEVDCEKQVGILRTDAQGEVVLGEDGSPTFSSAPETILTVDSYPVTLGWKLGVNNLAGEPSTVRQVEDPLLAAWGATLFGAPAAPFELAVGETRTFTAGLRLESYEQCLALAGEPPSGDGPSCRDVTENRLVVTTDTNVAECRARLVCRPQQQQRCSTPEWKGLLEYFGPEGDPATIAQGFGVAVGCDGQTHVAGDASFLATPGSSSALLARLDAAGTVAEERTWSPSPRNEAWAVALDRWGRRIVVGGAVQTGFLRIVEPDGSVAWEETAPRVAHGAASFRDAKPDAEGNVYTALVVQGPFTGTPPPDDQDAVVRKYTPSGALVWETALATGHQDDVSALAVTPLGEVYVAGFTLGDLIPGTPASSGPFLARLGPDGAIRWVRQVPFVGAALHGLAVDVLGNLALTGEASVATLDGDGNVRWQRPIAMAKPGTGAGVAIDSTGAVWVVGATEQVTASDPTVSSDAFVARYDAAGTLLWTKQLGGAFPVLDDLQDIVVDAAGYGVAVGSTASPDPVHGGILRANVVLLRIAPDGTY